jgi:biopolymer transport protein ExbD
VQPKGFDRGASDAEKEHAMAGINVNAGHGSTRSLNHEIPLIPFIDFLLCLVAFLLVTAVWSQMARINADAKVPGAEDRGEPPTIAPEKELHVEMRGDKRFQLIWKEGSTVINTIDVERKPVNIGGDGDIQYPALAGRIATEWQSNGSHRAPTDGKRDRAVLHTDNAAPFSDLIAVIDAVHEAKRPYTFGSKTESAPAFNLTFAVN